MRHRSRSVVMAALVSVAAVATVAVIALGLGWTAGSFAMRGDHSGRAGARRGDGRHDGSHVGRLLERLTADESLQGRLDLSESQVQRLKEIRDRATREIASLRADVRAHREDIRSLLRDASAARSDIEKQASELASSAQVMARQITTTLLDARDVLSVEQRERLRDEIRESLGSLRGERGRTGHSRRHHRPSADDGDEPPSAQDESEDEF